MARLVEAGGLESSKRVDMKGLDLSNWIELARFVNQNWSSATPAGSVNKAGLGMARLGKSN
jgi:hypothetical protein